MIRRPPRSTLFPTRRSSDLRQHPDRVLGRHGGDDAPAEYAELVERLQVGLDAGAADRKRTRLDSSHSQNSYSVFCLKKKKNKLKTNLTYELRAADVLNCLY